MRGNFMMGKPRLRRFAKLATGSWLSRGYLALVAVSVPVVLLVPDLGLVVDPMMLTAPLSFAGVVLPFGPGSATEGAGGVVAVVLWGLWLLLCALVNAAVLGALMESRADRAPVPQAPVTRAARPRALLAPAVDNWLSRSYLALVAAALGFFLYAMYVLPDPGFAGIWPLLAAAPLSFVALLAAVPDSGWLGTAAFSVGVALSGLVNAALLGLLVRRARLTQTPMYPWQT